MKKPKVEKPKVKESTEPNPKEGKEKNRFPKKKK
jgi:hypothetical protein